MTDARPANQQHDVCPMKALQNDNRPITGSNKTLPNGDIVCWYCGSWSRKQFNAHCRKMLAGDESITNSVTVCAMNMVFCTLGMNRRNDKIYIRRDSVKNASEGAIKILTPHLLPEDVYLFEAVIDKAHKLGAILD